MIELYISYFSGEFFVATFEDKAVAEKHYNENKECYSDDRGAKYGFPYGTPIYQEVKE